MYRHPQPPTATLPSRTLFPHGTWLTGRDTMLPILRATRSCAEPLPATREPSFRLSRSTTTLQSAWTIEAIPTRLFGRKAEFGRGHAGSLNERISQSIAAD